MKTPSGFLSVFDLSTVLHDIPDAAFATGGAVTNACKAVGYDESGRATINGLNAWGWTVARLIVFLEA